MEGRTPKRFMHTSREAELVEVLKRIHFDLQEFFATHDADQIGVSATGFVEHARALAAEVIGEPHADIRALTEDEWRQIANGIITGGLRHKASQVLRGGS